MNKKIIVIAATLFTALGSANAQADSFGLTAISVNGDKMVNDSVLNVTWADKESPLVLFGAPRLGSVTAQEWIAQLNSQLYGGYSDWRLPTGADGANHTICQQSSLDELGCLFIDELGNVYGQKATNLNPFTSIISNYIYWSSTEGVVGTNVTGKFIISFDTGHSTMYPMNADSYGKVVAIRTGQVAPVPVPATVWLLLSSIGGLGVFARKRKA